MSVNEIVLKDRDTLRKTKTNEAQRRKQAENIRRRGLEQMAERDPSVSAKRQMQQQAVSGRGADPGAGRADAQGRRGRICSEKVRDRCSERGDRRWTRDWKRIT